VATSGVERQTSVKGPMSSSGVKRLPPSKVKNPKAAKVRYCARGKTGDGSIVLF
jgi:hypothetical protein